MTTTKATKQAHGCKCGCGMPTFGRYAPGHDARHVAYFVRRAVEMAAKSSPWEVGQVWQAALRGLATPALQAKFRRSMKAGAERHLGPIIDRMDDGAWQQAIHLQALLARDDSQFDRPLAWSTRNLAIWAAALGWTRHSVNTKRS